MKAKRIFWKSINICTGAWCPFVGVEVDGYDQFIELMKNKLFERSKEEPTKGYYPPYTFSTKDRNIKITFCGSYGYKEGINVPINPATGRPYKWAIYNNKTGEYIKFFAIQDRKSFEEIYQLFEDSDKVQRELDAMTALCKASGGLTFNVCK